jgi:hypothetical protein
MGVQTSIFLSVRPKMAYVFVMGYRHPRASRGPEPPPGLNWLEQGVAASVLGALDSRFSRE